MNTNNKTQPAHVFFDFEEQISVDILNLVKEKKIKMVYWDLGGTLVDISATTKEQIVKQINALCNSNISVTLYDQAIRDEWKHRENPAALERIKSICNDDDEKLYWIEFYTCALKGLGIRDTYWGQFVQRLAEMQANPDSFVIFSYVTRTFKKLRKSGIRIGIISNAFPSARKILEHTNLIQKFDAKHIILSYEYNSVKPERAIYDEAVKIAGVEAYQVLFIDDRRSFVKGAAKSGMRAIIIQTNMTSALLHKMRQVVFLIFLAFFRFLVVISHEFSQKKFVNPDTPPAH